MIVNYQVVCYVSLSFSLLDYKTLIIVLLLVLGNGFRQSVAQYHLLYRGQSRGRPTTNNGNNEPQNPTLITLALRTLAEFNLHEYNLLPFVRETVSTYVTNNIIFIFKIEIKLMKNHEYL